MKILLIRPPYARLRSSGAKPCFPLGLGYIASVLKQHGYETSLYHADNPRSKEEQIFSDPEAGFKTRVDSYRRYLDSLKDNDHFVWKEIKETFEIQNPDIVGVSLLSAEVGSALKVSQICKEVNKKCHIVWGGVHPTFLAEDCLKYGEVDFVIRGEGEYAMTELCQALSTFDKNLFDIRGLSYRRNGTVVHNDDRDLIEDLDEIPFPAWDTLLYPETFDYKSLISIIISRGCPFRCSFCASRSFWRRKVRFRSPENMIKEVKLLKETYGINYFMIWDDSFTINKDIVKKYCNALIESKLRIAWKASTRADLIDEPLLKLMKKAGCRKLEVGVESGSDRIKKMICKDVSNEQIINAFEIIKKIGIGSGAFFMAGFPEETLEDLRLTFELMHELKADELFFNIFDPMPGTPEYEKCIKLGLLPKDADWNKFLFWPCAHYSVNIEKEEFTKYVHIIAKWLYENDNRFVNRFKRNRYLAMTLLMNDPILLIYKIFNNLQRVLKRRYRIS